MATPNVHNLEIYKGDTFVEDFHLQNQNGTDFDLTDWVLTAELRDMPGGTLLATFSVTVTDATGGLFEIELTPAVSDALDAGVLINYWDIQGENVDGTIETWWRGQATVTEDITE